MSDLVIAVDAMGGDLGPHQSVPALLQALSIYPKLKFIVTGDRNVLDPVLKHMVYLHHPQIERVHTPDVIRQDQPLSTFYVHRLSFFFYVGSADKSSKKQALHVSVLGILAP